LPRPTSDPKRLAARCDVVRATTGHQAMCRDRLQHVAGRVPHGGESAAFGEHPNAVLVEVGNIAGEDVLVAAVAQVDPAEPFRLAVLLMRAFPETLTRRNPSAPLRLAGLSGKRLSVEPPSKTMPAKAFPPAVLSRDAG